MKDGLGFLQLIVLFLISFFIVVIVKRMSQSSISIKDTHYRCSNDFYHVFSQREIEYTYGKVKSTYLCPNSGCGGKLTLYEAINDEEYDELKRLNYFSDL